jgi:hypothetical protein
MDGNKHVCSFQHNGPLKINENSLAFRFVGIHNKTAGTCIGQRTVTICLLGTQLAVLKRNGRKAVPVHTMKVYTERRGTAPHILKFSTRSRWVCGLQVRSLYLWGQYLHYSLNRLVWAIDRVWTSLMKREIGSAAPARNRTQTVQSIAFLTTVME